MISKHLQVYTGTSKMTKKVFALEIRFSSFSALQFGIEVQCDVRFMSIKYWNKLSFSLLSFIFFM